MSEKSEIESARFCILMCWLAGIVGGLIVAVISVKALGLHALAGLFLGFLATLALAFLFYWLFCDEKKDAEARKANAWVDAEDIPEAEELSEAEVAETTPEVADAAQSEAVEAGSEGASAPEAEIDAATEARAPEPKADAAPQAAPESKSAIQPSKPLAGEAELASRKGEWRYGSDGDAAPAADVAPAETAPVEEDFDKDGVLEGKDEGTRPVALDGPRDGKADNLKEIKGVGPKMEQMLNGMGFFHFDQIAAWSVDEVAWVNANLEGFKGRVTRDNWVEQAIVLASGGETEFSKRVEDGDVY